MLTLLRSKVKNKFSIREIVKAKEMWISFAIIPQAAKIIAIGVDEYFIKMEKLCITI